jgi:hypothetical protein
MSRRDCEAGKSGRRRRKCEPIHRIVDRRKVRSISEIWLQDTTHDQPTLKAGHMFHESHVP